MPQRKTLWTAGVILALVSGTDLLGAERYLPRNGPPPLRFGPRPSFPKPPVPLPPPFELAAVTESKPEVAETAATPADPTPKSVVPAPLPPLDTASATVSLPPPANPAPLNTQVLIPFFTGLPGNGGGGGPNVVVGPVAFVPPTTATSGNTSRATYSTSPPSP